MAYIDNSANGYASNMYKMGNVEMGVEVSKKVLPKIFAKIAYHKGYMVNDRYNAEAQNAMDVLIPKYNRPTGKFVNLRSGSYNAFSPNTEQVTQKYDLLQIDREYNEIIEIAEDQIVQNVQGDGIISTMSDMVSSIVAEQINILTCAGIVDANLKYGTSKPAGEAKVEYVTLTGNNATAIPDVIGEAIAKIGNADPDFGDTSFNDYKMSGVFSNTMWANLLKTKNQFLLESSYGQELLIEGTFGRITLGDVNAFKGKILGLYTFVLPDAFFPTSTNAEFDVKPTSGKVLGVMGVAEATERAFIDRGINIVPAVTYRGWVLQPLYRVGVACLKPWGTALLVTDDFVDNRLSAFEKEDKTDNITMAQGSATGKTKVATLPAFTGSYYYYNLSNDADGIVVPRNKDLSADNNFTALTLNSTEIASAVAGHCLTVVACDSDKKAIGVVYHTLVAGDIKA